MRVRWAGLTLAVVLLGLAAGYGIGVLRQNEPTTFAVAGPVPASDPSIPVLPRPGFEPDIDYPTLQPGLTYVTREIGTADYRWEYDVPVGWIPVDRAFVELRWRPPDEPEAGGYSMRVKIINAHLPTADMVAQKEVAVEALYRDVEILDRTDDLLAFSYRDPFTNRQRFNTFMWFTAPGGTTADFEMSVVGRVVDQEGLDDLRERVAASITKVG
jgi:hypothetical protein